MLSWMLYGAAVSSVLALAASAAERGLRMWKRPARWVWLAALLASLLLPGVAGFVPGPAPRASSPPVGRPVTAARAGTGVPSTRIDRFFDVDASWRDWTERPLRVVWLTLSCGFAATLLISAFHLRRQRRRWQSAVVAGTPVLISERLGPALVGLLRPAIVLPRWVLDADEDTQRLMVVHEREHLDAGDPALLAIALGCLALTPWNAPLWWIVRRLRHAIELDCDRRVLRGGVPSRAYGELLLRVSQGPAPGFAYVTPLLGEPVSYLERRIRAMKARMPRHPRLLTTVTGAAAGFGLCGAFAVPRPAMAFATVPDFISVWSEPRPGGAPSRAAAVPARNAVAGDTVPTARVRAALAQWNPELLRAPDPRVIVYFIADRAGVVQKTLVVPLAEMEHAVMTASPPRRPIQLSPGQVVVFDSTNSATLPGAVMVPGRDVVAEIRADVAPRRIQSVEMWQSQVVPGGLEVAWVTLR